MIRILIVSKLNTRESYGGSNRAFHLGRCLAEKAIVTHVGLDCSAVDYAPARSTGSVRLYAFARHVRRAIRDFRPDVVFALESRASLVCRALLRRSAHPRLVIGFDSSPAYEWKAYLTGSELSRPRCAARYALSWIAERVIVSGSAPIIVVSGFLRDLLVGWYGVTPDRIHIVPNGTPTEMLTRRPSSPPSPYASLRADAVALLVAPRNFYSNVAAVRFVHQVAACLAHTEPGLALVVLGGGPTLGESPNVHYMGHVPDVMPYVDFADVCLLPYPPCAVGSGARLKSMEYLARGKAVLSTPEGIRGADDLVAGLHAEVAMPEPEAFAAALSELLRDPARRRSLGAEGRRLVVERHDWRALAGQLLALFEELV